MVTKKSLNGDKTRAMLQKAAGRLPNSSFRCRCVSTHSRPKAAGQSEQWASRVVPGFNTQPPEGGWVFWLVTFKRGGLFQHTAARRRLGRCLITDAETVGFNTQPPEGGWPNSTPRYTSTGGSFNTQPPEGGWHIRPFRRILQRLVSTHSRPKAAASEAFMLNQADKVSTHSRPKAAGPLWWRLESPANRFNTQPPEGGWQGYMWLFDCDVAVSTHSRPKAAGSIVIYIFRMCDVSTHSRPKAAGILGNTSYPPFAGFNTQPPEGGWADVPPLQEAMRRFNTQPPEGGWCPSRCLRN